MRQILESYLSLLPHKSSYEGRVKIKSPIEKFCEFFPEYDFAILSHGLLPHGRDYFFTIQNCLGASNGTFRVTFTHCVELQYVTVLSAKNWMDSWADLFINYAEWEKHGEPSGYVWGTNWSNAYPGIKSILDSERALKWSASLGKSMHEFELETDRFNIKLVFHSLEIERINENEELISSVTIPL
jgi:hypothetical protein